MQELDKRKIGIFLIIIIIIFIGIKNNFSMEKDQEILQEKDLESKSLADHDKKESSDLSDSTLEKNEIKNEDQKEKADSKIYVHITGAINKPGLYKLDEGSRLDDLIKMCQGLKKDADIKKINLSMILKDQMRLHILSIGEKDDIEITNEQVASSNGSDSKDKKVNINTASKEELMTLPGIGEKRAMDIISYRDSKKIERIDDLKNISGIGDKSIEKLKDLIEI